MPLVSIRHATVYRYRTPVAFGEHRLMARPMECPGQRLLRADVTISPDPTHLSHIEDAAGAHIAVARFKGRADTLRFEARSLVEHSPVQAQHVHDDPALIGAEPFAYWPGEAVQLAPFIARAHADPAGEVARFARRFIRPVGRTHLATVLADMTHAIRREFSYGVRLHGAPQSPLETLESRRGSCRDFAVLMMDAARSLGLAAQFTSGYVYTTSSVAKRDGGGHTHAWMRAYLPAAGWFDFDPTNGLIGSTDLIRVAAVADPRQAIPLHGTWAGMRGAYLGMDVEVEITAQPAEDLQPNPIRRVAEPRH